MAGESIAQLGGICVQCGCEFEDRKRRGPKRKYCSALCRGRANHPLKDRITSFCKICGSAFSHKKIGARYCSLNCGAKSRYAPVYHGMRQCQQCGQDFTPKARAHHKVFCSRTCRNKYGRLTDTYRMGKQRRINLLRANIVAEKFSAHEIFERDRWRCQICKRKVDRLRGQFDERYPHLDHVIPLAIGGAHTKANTQTLCRGCNMAKGATIPSQTQLRLIG